MHIFDDMTITVKLSEKQTVVAIAIAVVVFTNRHPDTATQVDIGSKLKVFAKESLHCVTIVHIACQLSQLHVVADKIWVVLCSRTASIVLGIKVYRVCLSPYLLSRHEEYGQNAKQHFDYSF